ncbi:DUF4349 domain-containing protein [Mastigocoleus testarum]|uniref:DUF4349 domain-containing protein n=1 Tax=Mastigocoleus testarum BC008 TaxID=371196 RepID=A0A0V7ZFX0_9CYAN|nr:DUF4349 domain-containing protein [Mastigocoleus testarum]KST63482.1 hypothetical protein BC008_13535 [Mastigocoleus testarum BC008]
MQYKSTLFLMLLFAGTIFTSCASSTTESIKISESGEVSSDTFVAQRVSDASSKLIESPQAVKASRPKTQLIKKAAMTAIVDSVEESIDAVLEIITKQQGDLIKLEQKQPRNNRTPYKALIQMRVPQNLLTLTLDELAKLGTVQSRNITAQDVSDRLVDIQARLNNLRKTEANLQKLIDRAKSVKDILSVTQELSKVREQIERIDAQLKNLQNQVAYSTITLNLEAAVVNSSPKPNFGSQIKSTWNNSSNSVVEFTIGLLKIGIWLVAYTPYLLIMLAAAYGINKWRRSSNNLN